MRTMTQHSIPTRVMFVLLALLILTQPLFVASSPTIPSRPQATDTLSASAERYITSLSQVVRLSTALIGPINAVRTTPPTQLPEPFVAQARQQALDLAVQSALAIGALDDFAAEVERLGGTLPPAIDIAQTVAAGLPPETRQDLAQVVGLNAAQIDGIEQNLQQLASARLAIATTGLPQDVQNQLRRDGFSQADIDRIAQTLANKGLADTTQTTRLGQFQATKWELSILRTRALILATQLLRTQTTALQAHGVEPKPATQGDLTALANDQLRLLTHIAALKATWGSDPRLERGEGQWWFIERYAQRAGERLAQVMRTTQNPAFAVDVFVIDQIRTLAITARSGDPAFVKVELERLNDLLAFQLGDAVVDGAQAIEPPGAVVAPPEQVSDDALTTTAVRVDPAVRARIVLVANDRLAQAQSSAVGAIAEANENNNTYDFIFPYVANTQVQLAPEVTAALEENFGHVDPARAEVIAWFWGVVTGQSDDWTALVGNFVFSVIPVLGIIPDLATLATSDDWFEKALAVIGIIASLGDLLALVPGLQAAGGGSAVADGLAAGFKVTYRTFATGVARDVLKNLTSFDVAFTIAKGLIEATGKLFVKELTDLISSPQRFVDFVKGIGFNFATLVKILKEPGLRQIGVTMGGLMLGGLINRGKQIPGQLIQPLIRLFDRVAGTSLAKSDEALAGIAEVVDNVGEPGAWRVLERLGCVTQVVTAQASARPAVIALLDAPVAQAEESDPCALATTFLKSVYNMSEITWADEGLEGLEAILRHVPDGEAYAKSIVSTLKDKYTDDVIQQTFALLGKQPTAWSDEAVDGLANLVNLKGRPFVESTLAGLTQKGYKDDIIQGTFEVLGTQKVPWSGVAIDGLANVVSLNGKDFVQATLTRLANKQYNDEVVQNTFMVLRRQTVIWSAEAVDGVARVVSFAGGDIANGIAIKLGGKLAGEQTFLMLDDFINIRTGKNDHLTLMKFLTGTYDNKEGGNFVSAAMELRYGYLLRKNNTGIQIYQDYPDNKKGIDFILDDVLKTHDELKNSTDYSDAVSQFREYVGILANGTAVTPRYTPQNFRHVFSGDYDQRAVDALCNVARSAVAMGAT